MNKNPLLTLNNGIQMPALGFGVYQSPPEQTASVVATAIADGYRLIDTAAAYFNEQQVGEGIRRSGIARSDLFVTTKLWISDYGYDEALRGFEASLDRLGMDYVDLYLLHWPMPSEFDRTVGAYRAAEKLLAQKRTRAIGVCNHGPRDLEQLIARTHVVPTVNQVELNPFFAQRAVRDADARYGIVTQAWSPIGGVNRYHASGRARDPLKDPVIERLAQKYGKTAAQVILRWHVDHGWSAIPKSVHPARIAENIDIFDFSLTADEMTSLDALDTGVRGGPDPEIVDTKLFTLRVDNRVPVGA
jgi:diketogulonate reductase-like aldo/keto reductase